MNLHIWPHQRGVSYITLHQKIHPSNLLPSTWRIHYSVPGATADADAGSARAASSDRMTPTSTSAAYDERLAAVCLWKAAASSRGRLLMLPCGSYRQYTHGRQPDGWNPSEGASGLAGSHGRPSTSRRYGGPPCINVLPRHLFQSSNICSGAELYIWPTLRATVDTHKHLVMLWTTR